MTLLDTTRSLNDQLDQHKTWRDTTNKAAAFRTRATQLRPLSVQIVHLDSARESLESVGILSAEPRTFFSAKLLGRITQIRAAFLESPQSLLEDVSLEPTFFSPLRASLAAWEESLKSAWRTAVIFRLGDLPDDLLSVLRPVPQFSSRASQLREIQRAGMEIADTLPLVDVDLDNLLASVDALKSRKSALLEDLEGIPGEVVRFIAACAIGRGQLADLTTTVQKWIAENGLLSTFRITL